jgi:hypothetical protein
MSQSTVPLPSIHGNIDRDIFADVPKSMAELWHIEFILHTLELLITGAVSSSRLKNLSQQTQNNLKGKILILDGVRLSLWSQDKVPVHAGFDKKCPTTINVPQIKVPMLIDQWPDDFIGHHKSSAMNIVACALFCPQVHCVIRRR